jgi:CheY-like chemotaxis protein
MSESKVLEALFPGPRRYILRAMYLEPDRWWSLRDLAGRAGIQPDSLRQHIAHLYHGGLVRARRLKGRSWYQPNPECAVHAEIHSILTKLTGESAGSETILIVEDQPATAKITRILLESWGYRVLEAHAGDEALGVFAQQGCKIHLLLTDVMMPGMDGRDLARELRRLNPLLRVVYMSGYTNEEVLEPGCALLTKPFNPARLSRIVRKELDRPAAQRSRINRA